MLSMATVLSNGKQIRGEIMSESVRKYKFKSNGRTFIIRKEDVLKVVPVREKTKKSLGDLE